MQGPWLRQHLCYRPHLSRQLRERVVVPGETVTRGGGTFREILTGLEPGDMVVTGDE